MNRLLNKAARCLKGKRHLSILIICFCYIALLCDYIPPFTDAYNIYMEEQQNEKRKEQQKDPRLTVSLDALRLNDSVLCQFIVVYEGKYQIKDTTYRVKLDTLHQYEKKDTIINVVRKSVGTFLIGEIPVTKKLWKYVMREDDLSSFDNKYLTYVENKTPQEWAEFISRLNLKTGRVFRLPTNEEWQYAAQGGRESLGYMYAGSNDINKVANYRNNTETGAMLIGKEKAPNELGLYDMSGSVWELTSTRGISRGGAWDSNAQDCLIDPPFYLRMDCSGARLVLER